MYSSYVSKTAGKYGVSKFGSKEVPKSSKEVPKSSKEVPKSCKKDASVKQKQAKAIMEFSKADLLRLLGLLEAELQARDVVINSLKIERAKLLRPPKNHHRQYTLANPYTALVRDTEKGMVVNEAEEEKGKGSDTKDVVASLQAVIEQHKKAEERMKAQLQAMKASHTKAVKDLEDEKKKHAQDTAQGDDVTYMLEKERERLMQQVDFEKAQQRKLERECKRAQGRMIQERKKHVEFTKIMLDKHIQLAQQLADAQQRVMEWETQAQAMRAEAQNASKIAAEERNKAVKMEAEMEKKLSEFDIEREQLLGRLHREEVRTKELRTELDGVKSAPQKPAPLMNGRVMTGSELNSNTKGSAAKSIPNSADTKTGKNKGTSNSLRNPSALSNPKSSVKLFGAKGYKSPPRSDKSEGSSSGSEDLNVTASVKIRSVSPAAPSAKSSASDSRSKDKPSVAASKPKTSTTNFTKGAGSQSRPLSPATSLDRLSGKSTSSSSLSSSHQKGTKIPSSSSMFANSPQTKKSTPTVAVVAPQPSKAVVAPQPSKAVVAPQPSKAVPQESNKSQHSVHKKQSEVTNAAKTEKTESTPKAGHLSRPTALLTSDSGNKSGELSNKAALLRNTLASPKEPSPRDRSPTRSFGGVNVRAAAAQLTSPVGKKVFNPLSVIPPASNPTSSTHSGSSGGATTTTTTATSQATGGGSSTATSNTVKPPVTSPSSTTPGKRNVSPRGTPPPIPPNKPTLIPHKSSAPSTSSSTSSSSSTSPVTPPAAATSLSTQSSTTTTTTSSKPESGGSKSLLTSPLPSSRKSDSLVEARKQLFANKLGSGVGISATNLRPPFESSSPVLMVNNSNSNSLESLNVKNTTSLVAGNSIQGKAAAQAVPLV